MDADATNRPHSDYRDIIERDARLKAELLTLMSSRLRNLSPMAPHYAIDAVRSDYARDLAEIDMMTCAALLSPEMYADQREEGNV